MSDSDFESVALSEVEKDDDQYEPPPSPPTPAPPAPKVRSMAVRMAETRKRQSLAENGSALMATDARKVNSTEKIPSKLAIDTSSTPIIWDEMVSPEAPAPKETEKERLARLRREKRLKTKEMASKALQDAAQQALNMPPSQPVNAAPPAKKSARKATRPRASTSKKKTAEAEPQTTTAVLSQEAATTSKPTPQRIRKKPSAAEIRKAKELAKRKAAEEAKDVNQTAPPNTENDQQEVEHDEVVDVDGEVMDDTDEVHVVSVSPIKKTAKVTPRPRGRALKPKPVEQKDVLTVEAGEKTAPASEAPSRPKTKSTTTRVKKVPHSATKNDAPEQRVAVENGQPDSEVTTSLVEKPVRPKKSVKTRPTTAKAAAAKSLQAKQAAADHESNAGPEKYEGESPQAEDEPMEDADVAESSNVAAESEPIKTPTKKVAQPKRVVKPRSRAVKAPTVKEAKAVVEAGTNPNDNQESWKAQDEQTDDAKGTLNSQQNADESAPSPVVKKVVRARKVAKPRTSATKSRTTKALAGNEKGEDTGANGAIGMEEVVPSEDEHMEDASGSKSVAEEPETGDRVAEKKVIRAKKVVKPRPGVAKTKVVKTRTAAETVEEGDVKIVSKAKPPIQRNVVEKDEDGNWNSAAELGGEKGNETTNTDDSDKRKGAVKRPATDFASDEMATKRAKQGSNGADELLRGAHLLDDLQNELTGYGKRQDGIVDRFVDDVCEMKERWRVCINAARWEMRRKQEEALRSFAVEVSHVLRDRQGALGDLVRSGAMKEERQ